MLHLLPGDVATYHDAHTASTGPTDPFTLAQRHLQRAQIASREPVDWSILSTYGFYCLEAAVMAAADHVGMTVKHTHTAKAKAAQQLASSHALPDISSLLRDLNDARKASAYGDTAFPDLDADDLIRDIEEYVERVGELLDSEFDDEEDDEAGENSAEPPAAS